MFSILDKYWNARFCRGFAFGGLAIYRSHSFSLRQRWSLKAFNMYRKVGSCWVLCVFSFVYGNKLFPAQGFIMSFAPLQRCNWIRSRLQKAWIYYIPKNIYSAVTYLELDPFYISYDCIVESFSSLKLQCLQAPYFILSAASYKLYLTHYKLL